jgi:hypothetical protein
MQRMQLALSVASYPMESGSKLPGYGGAVMNSAAQYFVIITLAADVGMAAYLMLQMWRDRK